MGRNHDEKLLKEIEKERREHFLGFLIDRFDDPDYVGNPIVIDHEDVFYRSDYDRDNIIVALLRSVILLTMEKDPDDEIVA